MCGHVISVSEWEHHKPIFHIFACGLSVAHWVRHPYPIHSGSVAYPGGDGEDVWVCEVFYVELACVGLYECCGWVAVDSGNPPTVLSVHRYIATHQ
jgi:hypothetical protein